MEPTLDQLNKEIEEISDCLLMMQAEVVRNGAICSAETYNNNPYLKNPELYDRWPRVGR